MLNKKGELTTTQLVTIIVLIASFAIILILLFRLNLGETTDSEICRNSVVLKGRTEGFAGTLDCKTQYICISGGSDCTNFSATEKVKVNSEERNETLEAIAEAALQQIQLQHYVGHIRQYSYIKTVLTVGLAFDGKKAHCQFLAVAMS